MYIKNYFGRYVDAEGLALAEILRGQDFEAKKEMMELMAPLAGFRNNPEDEEYWRLMSDAQIKKLSGYPRATIGSHGYYHNDLARIDLDKAEKELIKSKQYLERVTGKVIRSIAFPYGSYSPEVKELALKAGYKQLLGTEAILPEDEGNINLRSRLTVNPFIPVHAQMQAIIKGYYARWK